MTEQLPIPLSRADCYLATAAGMTGVILPANGPQSREEQYLARMAGDTEQEIPAPLPLKEQWLAIICGDTSVTTPEIKGAFLIGQQMVRVEFLAKAAGVEGIILPTNPNRTEQYFANIGGIVPDPGVLTQAKGTYIVLNNVLRGIDSLDYIYGDTYQQTYSGKNLLRNSYHTETINDVTFTCNADGTITVNGTASANTNYYINSSTPYLLPEGTYTLSTGGIVSSDTTYFVFGDGEGTVYWDSRVEQRMTQTVPAGGINVNFRIVVRSGVTLNNVVFRLQLESGSTATSYEKFVGGIPSPNPDYPQDIQVVTGEQTVTISDGNQSQDYKVSLVGKNLLDPSRMINGYVLSTGGIATVAITTGDMATPYFIPVEPNSSVTMTIFETSSTYAPWFGLCEYSEANESSFISPRQVNQTAGITSATFTVGANTHFIRVSARNLQDATKYQLELGPSSTSYAPYFTPIELCKIGTYQDYIYKSGDDWYVHKETGKVVLDGNANVGSYIATQGDYFITQIVSNLWKHNSEFIADRFSYKPNWGTGYNYESIYYGGVNGEHMDFKISSSRLASVTVANIKTWFGSNNTTVYYQLATLTDTKITDSTLIGQLEALNSAILSSPDAFIQVTGNLAGEIEISYYAKSE